MKAETGQARAPRFADKIADRYGTMHPAILRHLIAWVLLMREGFDGDLDCMVILAVAGDRVLKDPSLREWSYRDLLVKPQIDARIPLTNRKSIADSTGIPRETVRRKVAMLIDRGWLVEQPDGSLMPTKKAAEELHFTTLRSFEILGHLAEALVSVSREA